MSDDKIPPYVRVWTCPQCGYWREDKSTGVHVNFDSGTAETHELEEAQYIFHGMTGEKGLVDHGR